MVNLKKNQVKKNSKVRKVIADKWIFAGLIVCWFVHAKNISVGHKFTSFDNTGNQKLGVTEYVGLKPSSSKYKESIQVEINIKKSLHNVIAVSRLPLGKPTK